MAGLRWATDFEHLPKPGGRPGKLRWMLGKAPGYLRLIARQRARLWLAPRRAGSLDPAASAVLDELRAQGVLVLSLSEAERRALAELLRPHFEQLAGRLERIPPQQRMFDDNRLVLAEAQHPATYQWFREVLARLGVQQAASAYLGRPVDVAHVVPQINSTEDGFWGHPFDDVGLAAQRCDYLHFDTAYRVVKLIVYVGKVGPANGPFSFVRASHRRPAGLWDGLCRRANDYAGLSSTRRPARQLFTALPAALRRKAAFGPDVLDADPSSQRLLDHEWVITSDQGSCVVFDPQGIHRGGMVRTGTRRVVSIMMAESSAVPGFD